MTTITIENGVENLQKKSYGSYQELMEDLAELHGHKILWEVDNDDLTSEELNLAEKAVEMIQSNPEAFARVVNQ